MVGKNVKVSLLPPASWVFSFDDVLGIRVECPWRLIHQGKIAVSSEDHDQQFGLPSPVDAAAKGSALLAGAQIQQVNVREGTADLLIHLDGDLRLEIIPFSSGYESWHVFTPSGEQIIATGGGTLASWDASIPSTVTEKTV